MIYRLEYEGTTVLVKDTVLTEVIDGVEAKWLMDAIGPFKDKIRKGAIESMDADNEPITFGDKIISYSSVYKMVDPEGFKKEVEERIDCEMDDLDEYIRREGVAGKWDSYTVFGQKVEFQVIMK